jgi:hypothetical protein
MIRSLLFDRYYEHNTKLDRTRTLLSSASSTERCHAPWKRTIQPRTYIRLWRLPAEYQSAVMDLLALQRLTFRDSRDTGSAIYRSSYHLTTYPRRQIKLPRDPHFYWARDLMLDPFYKVIGGRGASEVLFDLSERLSFQHHLIVVW